MKNIEEKILMAEEKIKQLQNKRKKLISKQKQEERKKVIEGYMKKEQSLKVSLLKVRTQKWQLQNKKNQYNRL